MTNAEFIVIVFQATLPLLAVLGAFLLMLHLAKSSKSHSPRSTATKFYFKSCYCSYCNNQRALDQALGLYEGIVPDSHRERWDGTKNEKSHDGE